MGQPTTRRLLCVLEAFAQWGDKPVGITELSELTDLPKSTVHRIVESLFESGVVFRVGYRYRLTDVGDSHRFSPAQSRQVAAVLRPFMLALYADTGRMVSLAVSTGTCARYLESMYPRRWTSIVLRSAPEVPLHCCAVGKVLLAFTPGLFPRYVNRCRLLKLTPYTVVDPKALERDLAHARIQGMAVEVEEHMRGFYSTAVPILDTRERAFAALSIASALGARDPDLHRFSSLLRTAGREASREVRRLLG